MYIKPADMGPPSNGTLVWPSSSQAFFPDSRIRENEDAAFCESLRVIQEECLDNSDVGSDIDEMTETPPKKKRAKNSLY
jgi:hypothetical protein